MGGAFTGARKRRRGTPTKGVVRAAVVHGNSARRGAGWKHRTTDLGIRSKRRDGGFGSMYPGTGAETLPQSPQQSAPDSPITVGQPIVPFRLVVRSEAAATPTTRRHDRPSGGFSRKTVSGFNRVGKSLSSGARTDDVAGWVTRSAPGSRQGDGRCIDRRRPHRRVTPQPRTTRRSRGGYRPAKGSL